MTVLDWLWFLLLRIIELLNPMIYAVGFIVALLAYRWGRKKGYIVIAVFFALAVYSHTLAPQVNRFLSRSLWPPEPTDDAQSEAFNQELEQLLAQYDPPSTRTIHSVSFPLGPIILVSGLWSVAKWEKRSEPGGAA